MDVSDILSCLARYAAREIYGVIVKEEKELDDSFIIVAEDRIFVVTVAQKTA